MKLSRVVSFTSAFVLAITTSVLAAPTTLDMSQSISKQRFDLQGLKGSKFLTNLTERLEKASNTEYFPVIVTFKSLDQVSNLQSAKGIISKFSPTKIYQTIPGMAAELTKAEIIALAKSSEVVRIEYDEPMFALSGTANKWYGTEKARTDFHVTGDRNSSETSYSKDDVVIAVIDTGIDASHVDLDGGKVIGFKDFVNNRTAAYDDQGHGTHCASIAAGTGEGNSAYKGVAPGAALVGVKVLNSQGSGSMSNVVAGIDWAVANKSTYGIEIISLSLGTNGSSDGTDATSQAVNRAVDAGIVVSAAAGNSGSYKKTVGSPAAAEKVITVGAGIDPGENGFGLAYFSSRGTTADGRIKPDVVAPGYKITAAAKGTTNGYVAYSGTSMATPFVAGTVALMLDANPSFTPSQVKTTIQNNSTDWGRPGKDIDYGWGLLRGYDAIKAAGSLSGTGPVLPYHLFAQDSIATAGKRDEWTFQVNSTSSPIGISLIIDNASGGFWGLFPTHDWTATLYDPSGVQVATSNSKKRQESIGFAPTKTGAYKLVVKSTKGTGSYFFDLSSTASGLTKTVNDQ